MIEKIKEKKKEYYEQNKEIINQKKKEIVCCSCGIEVQKNWIRAHEKTKKHQNFINQQNQEQ